MIDADTADFAYARLQRMGEDVETGYETAALKVSPAVPAPGKRPDATHIFS